MRLLVRSSAMIRTVVVAWGRRAAWSSWKIELSDAAVSEATACLSGMMWICSPTPETSRAETIVRSRLMLDWTSVMTSICVGG